MYLANDRKETSAGWNQRSAVFLSGVRGGTVAAPKVIGALGGLLLIAGL
jgi:hypothetical protein